MIEEKKEEMVFFDNKCPEKSEFGITTGRYMDASLSGGLSPNDFKTIADHLDISLENMYTDYYYKETLKPNPLVIGKHERKLFNVHLWLNPSVVLKEKFKNKTFLIKNVILLIGFGNKRNESPGNWIGPMSVELKNKKEEIDSVFFSFAVMHTKEGKPDEWIISKRDWNEVVETLIGKVVKNEQRKC